MGDRIEDLSIGHLAIFVLVVVRDAQQTILGSDPVPLTCRPVANRTVDRKDLLPPLQKALSNRKGYAGSPPITHFSGVHIVIAYRKLPEWRTDVVRGNSGILHRMTRNIVPHRNGSIDWGTGCATVGKKRAWFLEFHLTLPLHVAEKLDGGHLPMLSLEPQ